MYKFKVWTGSIMMMPKPISQLHQEVLTLAPGTNPDEWKYLPYTTRDDMKYQEIYEGDLVQVFFTPEQYGYTRYNNGPFEYKVVEFLTGLGAFSAISHGPILRVGSTYEQPELNALIGKNAYTQEDPMPNQDDYTTGAADASGEVYDQVMYAEYNKALFEWYKRNNVPLTSMQKITAEDYTEWCNRQPEPSDPVPFNL